MRSTGDEVDFGTGAVERGTDVGADRTGAEDCDFHGGTPFGLRDTAEVGEEVPRNSVGSILSMDIVYSMG